MKFFIAKSKVVDLAKKISLTHLTLLGNPYYEKTYYAGPPYYATFMIERCKTWCKVFLYHGHCVALSRCFCLLDWKIKLKLWSRINQRKYSIVEPLLSHPDRLKVLLFDC